MGQGDASVAHMAASPSSDDSTSIAMPTGIMLGMGWVRFLPPPSSMIFAALACCGEPTVSDIAMFSDLRNTNLGLGIPVWGELDADTDGEEAAEQRDQIGEIDRYAAGLGLKPVRTLGDVLDYMTACGLLVALPGADSNRYRLNPTPPLPGEVLNLDADVQAREDRFRWNDLHEPIAQQIIRLFTSPEAGHPTSKRTSLQRLARELMVDVETTRAGLTALLSSEDFTATRDPDTVTEHEVFEIHVDWDVFADTRVSIRRAGPDE